MKSMQETFYIKARIRMMYYTLKIYLVTILYLIELGSLKAYQTEDQ